MLGVANTTVAGPSRIRNRNTGGDFVAQGKRFRFAAIASRRRSSPSSRASDWPAGCATASRRSISWNYSPAAEVPEELRPGDRSSRARRSQLRSDATQTVSRRALPDVRGQGQDRPGRHHSACDAAQVPGAEHQHQRRSRYDFEQAKKPGRTGWVTPTITNSFLSDLLPAVHLEPHARPLARRRRASTPPTSTRFSAA